ncbi:MAG: DUF962 domain-containing protein [Chitinophagaceae bacterium]|nr:MAG: DUF962 domain-containing protein [Chitinophagaceae bacterium]
MGEEKKYKSFWEFYPYYLTEHSDSVCRELHFTGTLLFFVLLFSAFIFSNYWLLILLPFVGYGFAWVGHFFFEKNKPATFTYPLYSLGSDFVMFWHTLNGQIDEELKKADKKINNKAS